MNRTRHDSIEVDASSTAVLERLHEVVGEHLGPVLGAIRTERVDPVGGAQVRLRAGGARRLAVRAVADEDVQEGVLPGAGNCRSGLAADELLSLERKDLVPALEQAIEAAVRVGGESDEPIEEVMVSPFALNFVGLGEMGRYVAPELRAKLVSHVVDVMMGAVVPANRRFLGVRTEFCTPHASASRGGPAGPSAALEQTSAALAPPAPSRRLPARSHVEPSPSRPTRR